MKLIIGGARHPATGEVLFLTVGEESAGQRLDNFLIRLLKGVPKTHVYRIIRSGEVRVNRKRASADQRVLEGDLVRLPPVRTSEAAASKADHPAPAREFPVLFEDDHVLAIDKPAGVAVHGGSGVSFGVIEQLRQARPTAKMLELVHRLDRETSGILLVAKRRSALTRLQDQFRDRETGKTYLALVAGAWPANRKVIDQPLHKYVQADGERRVRVVSAGDPDGMRSITLVKVAESLTVFLPLPLGEGRGGGAAASITATLLEVTIKTGRTHQIRVHLTSAGHPILGDDKYGDFELNKALARQGLKRMFLHAWRLQFDHPASGERIELHAPLPPELHKSQNMSALRPRRFDLVAFDWDGTLFDSTQIIVRCIQQAVVEVGGAMPSERDAAYVIGMGLMDALAHAAPDVPTDRYAALGAAYRRHYVAQQNDLSLFDGVLPMLAELRSRHHWLAVATGKSRRGLDDVLKSVQLAGLFDGSRTADETAGKPDPRMLHELMREFGTEPERTLMVGDTTHDLQMALNAGCPSVAVSYGAHAPEGFADLRPLAIVHSVAELHDWLRDHA